jgi:hypothetical protein
LRGFRFPKSHPRASRCPSPTAFFIRISPSITSQLITQTYNILISHIPPPPLGHLSKIAPIVQKEHSPPEELVPEEEAADESSTEESGVGKRWKKVGKGIEIFFDTTAGEKYAKLRVGW